MTKLRVEQRSFSSRRAAFVEGSQTPRTFLEQCIAQIDAVEPVVKAFAHLNLEGARRAADESTERYRKGRTLSSLDGCPIGLKDIIETRDMPTGYGNPTFAGTSAPRDAACVLALRRAGAIMVGKTVTTEFAIGFSGATVNPHDTERTPGGSSSGSAASVAAGMLPVALGTQTNGSVLRPASYNGVLGYKGTFGSLPLGGVHPLCLSLDHLGILASDLDDVWATTSAIIDQVGSPGYPPLAGLDSKAPAARPPRKLVRLHLRAWDEVEASHREVFERQIEALHQSGIEIVDRRIKAIAELETMLDAHIGTSEDILTYEMRWPFAEYVAEYGDKIGARIRSVIARGSSVSPQDYARILQRRADARILTAKTLEGVGGDAFVMPAASGPAPLGYEHTGSRAYLVYWSWLGFPAISLPLMEADGLPWGLQLAHVGGRDNDMFSIAAALFPGKDV